MVEAAEPLTRMAEEKEQGLEDEPTPPPLSAKAQGKLPVGSHVPAPPTPALAPVPAPMMAAHLTPILMQATLYEQLVRTNTLPVMPPPVYISASHSAARAAKTAEMRVVL